MPELDDDLATRSRDELIAEVKRLRAGIRAHRDSAGHELCWYHPQLWALLPEPVEPRVEVPEWPQFLRAASVTDSHSTSSCRKRRAAAPSSPARRRRSPGGSQASCAFPPSACRGARAPATTSTCVSVPITQEDAVKFLCLAYGS